jgi:hypothetical protein
MLSLGLDPNLGMIGSTEEFLKGLEKQAEKEKKN